MLKFLQAASVAALIGCFAGGQAHAASVPYITGPVDPANQIQTLNQTIQSINSGVTPGSMAAYGTQRNFLDNGSMDVNQRAVTATAATTSGCAETSYSADRWCADVNMASGAGQLAVVTSTPSPYTGFTNSSTLVRSGGSLGQPQCALQEIPTIRATQLAGQVVDLSVYAQALAGLVADNGGTFNLYLITGTGSNQGLGSLRSAVGMTTTTKGSSMTISTSTGVITNATSVVAGQPVWMTASSMPTGITAGQTYYVSSASLNSGTSFAVAPTYAQAIAGTGTVIPSTGGSSVLINVPYITPVWTGLAVYGANGAGQGQSSAAQAFGQALSQTFTLSATSWGRFQTGPISVPATVTEAAVAVCFTPGTAATGGSTDGIAFVGAQLEIMGPNQTVAGPFEFRPVQQETLDALRYAWIIPEPAAAVATPFKGLYSPSTTVCELNAQTPVPMDVIPAVSFTGTALSTSTFKILNSGGAVALATTFLVQSTAGTPGLTAVDLSATTGASTAGWGCILIGNNAGAVINVGADF